MRTRISFLLMLGLIKIGLCVGQTMTFKNSPIDVEKWNETQLVIPIEIDIANNTASAINVTLILTLNNTTAASTSQLSAADFPGKFEIRNNNQNLSLKKGKEATKTFYLVLEKSLQIISDRIIFIDAANGVTTASLQVNLHRANDLNYTLSDYIENPDLKLDGVTKVESINNILVVSGDKDGSFQKRSIALKKGQALAVNEWSWIFNSFHWKPVPISLTTIPFKVRPATISNGKDFSGSASSGITNLGFNLDLGKYQMERYFATGKKSTHKFSLGFSAAPSVEELDSVYTNGANGLLGKTPGKMEKSKQLFISTGITISYSYNDISFVFVPFGWDFGTSTIGKQWIYTEQRWWGFGIAVSPKIFSTILNK